MANMVTELCIQCTHSAHSYGLFRDQNGAAFVLLVFVEEFFWEGGTAVPNFKTTWHGSNVGRTCSAFFWLQPTVWMQGRGSYRYCLWCCRPCWDAWLVRILAWAVCYGGSLQVFVVCSYIISGIIYYYITYNYMVTKVQYKQWFHDDNWHCGPPEATQLWFIDSTDSSIHVCQESPSSSSSQGCNSVMTATINTMVSCSSLARVETAWNTQVKTLELKHDWGIIVGFNGILKFSIGIFFRNRSKAEDSSTSSGARHKILELYQVYQPATIFGIAASHWLDSDYSCDMLPLPHWDFGLASMELYDWNQSPGEDSCTIMTSLRLELRTIIPSHRRAWITHFTTSVNHLDALNEQSLLLWETPLDLLESSWSRASHFWSSPKATCSTMLSSLHCLKSFRMMLFADD